MRWTALIRTVLLLSLSAAIGWGISRDTAAWAQIGSGVRPGAPSATPPASRFGSGSPAAPGAATGPAAGGAFTPLSDAPATTPPETTPPPLRGPGTPGDSTTLPGSAPTPEAGTPPRFGAPPPAATDRALDPGSSPPSTLPGRAPSAFENPSLDPLDPALRERYGDPMDRLDDRGAFPDSRTAPSADEERMAPAPEAPLPPPAAAEAAGDRGLAKMIYRNEAATFYLVFEEGVGHYHLPQPSAAGPQLYPSSNGDCLAQPMLGNGAHLASLRLEETSDANYWHYTASDGDQLTSEWAFAKRPSRDGGYAVYRQTREGWSRYGSFSRQAVR